MINNIRTHAEANIIHSLRLMTIILFFIAMANFSLQASNITSLELDCIESSSVGKEKAKVFEITSAFIATWQAITVRDHAVIQVIETNDFKTAYAITEQLRKIVAEPILVSNGFENNMIVYTITLGRFETIDKAMLYHDMLK